MVHPGRLAYLKVGGKGRVLEELLDRIHPQSGQRWPGQAGASMACWQPVPALQVWAGWRNGGPGTVWPRARLGTGRRQACSELTEGPRCSPGPRYSRRRRAFERRRICHRPPPDGNSPPGDRRPHGRCRRGCRRRKRESPRLPTGPTGPSALASGRRTGGRRFRAGLRGVAFAGPGGFAGVGGGGCVLVVSHVRNESFRKAPWKTRHVDTRRNFKNDPCIPNMTDY